MVSQSDSKVELWNFRNSAADIHTLGEFQLFLIFKKVQDFKFTNANDCPNLLSHLDTFRMGVFKACYPLHILVERENVPHFIPKSHGQNESRNESRIR